MHLTRVSCLVLYGDEDIFLLSRSTLKDIGIDMDSLLEQLAGGVNIAEADLDDVTCDDPKLSFHDDKQEYM